MFGHAPDGVYVESAESQLVVMCNGCLVAFPPDSVAPTTTGVINCYAGLPATGNPMTPCVQGQETLVDCRFCQALPACDPSVK